ncbi:50S ribosomal protein L35 [Candidatus Uhrbacteria bacterium]|nr:50S ribosomal protein L35 [Candidatus Uhrbacteria bacterium]
MAKLKTHKTVSKRFKITKTKKILKRYGGQDHFNARNPGKITRKKRRDGELSKSFHKTVRILTNTL